MAKHRVEDRLGAAIAEGDYVRWFYRDTADGDAVFIEAEVTNLNGAYGRLICRDDDGVQHAIQPSFVERVRD